MEGYGYRQYVTIITDGSNPEVVRHITDLFNERTEGNMYGYKATCHRLDDRHPTTMVVKSALPSDRVYSELQSTIETIYPALCIFNAPV